MPTNMTLTSDTYLPFLIDCPSYRVARLYGLFHR